MSPAFAHKQEIIGIHVHHLMRGWGKSEGFIFISITKNADCRHIKSIAVAYKTWHFLMSGGREGLILSPEQQM